jgi:phage terminase small subunit
LRQLADALQAVGLEKEQAVAKLAVTVTRQEQILQAVQFLRIHDAKWQRTHIEALIKDTTEARKALVSLADSFGAINPLTALSQRIDTVIAGVKSERLSLLTSK